MRRCKTGKHIYASVEKAEAAAALAEIRFKHPMRAYGCPECGQYHITSQADNAHKYKPFDIESMLLQAVMDGAAKQVDRLARGAARYKHDGYVFVYAPNGRSVITVERTPQPNDFLVEAVAEGRCKMVKKLSNSLRLFEYEEGGKLYRFTYSKSTKEVVIRCVKEIAELSATGKGVRK